MSSTRTVTIQSSAVGTQWPGVGCGVYVRKDNRVLFGRRGNKSHFSTGVWCAPGGKLDFGETFEVSAKREVLEEAGIEITNVHVLGVTNDIYPDESRHFITLALVADFVYGEPQVTEIGKMEAWEWLTWDEVLQRPLLLSTRNLIAQDLNPFAREAQ